jgi:hypothetical protein
VRSYGVFVSFFFPLIYIIIGIILAKLISDYYKPEDASNYYKNFEQMIIMIIIGFFTTIAFAYTTSTIVAYPVMER